MFLRIMFIFVLLLSTNSFAELTSGELEVQRRIEVATKAAAEASAASRAENQAYSSALSTFGSAVARSAGSTWQDLRSSTSALLTSARSSLSQTLNPGGADSDAAIDAAATRRLNQNAAAMDAAQARARQAREAAAGKFTTALDRSMDAYRATNDAIISTTSAAAAAAYQKSKEKAFDTWMATIGGLQAEMSSLNSNFSDLNEAKTFLDRKMDKSVLAFYMQDKFTKLLNSDVFCKAASAPTCKTGKNESQFKAADLNSIFPFKSGASSAAPAAAPGGATRR